jgi:large subunit ribosomal protein L10
MANKAVLDAKKEIVSEIADKVKDSASIIFFDYRGLTVAEVTELRNLLKKSNSDIKIYKNTLTKIALDNLKINIDNCLTGPNAISFSKDAIEPIKIISNYAKTHKALSVKGGIVDGEVTSIDKLEVLATIPSREVLLTMLAGGMIGIVRDLSVCLQLYSEQKNE